MANSTSPKKGCDPFRIVSLLKSGVSQEYEKGFSLIYDCFRNDILAPIRRYPKFRREREDHLQEVILRFFVWWLRNAARFEPEKMGGFLVQISKNRLANLLRKENPEISMEKMDEIYEYTADDDRRAGVLDRLRKLPEDCRKIIAFRLEDGKTWLEIAELLGIIDPEKVRSRYYHCINMMRK